MNNVFPFVVAFAILVNVHELGHYFVARWCGVKILRFSIGLGKVVFSRRFGPDQTEWAISMIPLGGYVMMLDERNQDLANASESDLKREFTRQSVWRRMAIVAAGPAANFLLAIVVLSCLFMKGTPDFAANLRVVPEHSAAYDAGLHGGEHVLTVNGKAIRGWSDLRWNVMQSALDKKPAQLEFERSDGNRGSAAITLDGLTAKDIEGDFMAKVGLEPVWPKAEIVDVVPGGPGMRAGLHQGDLILAVNGKPAVDTEDVIKTVTSLPGKPVTLTIKRGATNLDIGVVPDAVKEGDRTVGRINIHFGKVESISVEHGPFESFGLAAQRTWEMSVLQVTMIGKMITGSVSWRNINGVISIADYAGQAAQAGLTTYLSFLASISIAIGVMNLLPIPVLDGGLLLYYSLEVLTRRPIPRRFGEIAQIAGIVMLATLMTVALFNDFVRLDLVKKIAELVGAA
jgi:regulator of sigma E protease